ncbi:IucA/IucC family protein [Aneurinibacillus danicus]|uniref:Petrobactin biosynthesis protein AsbA n=2 Tax=Aneurinibacillus TaxID=55079 RepID=A0A511V1Y1_9BACL|nr:IucA/IucC family protein [Aneurinibacillus danicus]GEN32916.1 petrobactin biosynthesis protein AsbA [Aneurinibacillus danicus]
MNHMKDIAERATIQSFLNCYLRETENYTERSPGLFGNKLFANHVHVPETVLVSSLSSQQIEIIIPVRYWSATGRHLFSFPIYYRTKESSDPQPADYVTLVSLITKELLLEQGRTDAEDEFMLRVILSCRNIRRYAESRVKDALALAEPDFSFIEAEQSLLFGHLLHPTPKSKQGISEEEERIFSPELKGKFQLHYFKAHPSIVLQDSSTGTSAADMIREEMRSDPAMEERFIEAYCRSDGFILLPAHPLQASALVEKPEVQALMDRGLLEYLGPKGRLFTATSSVRTVYSRQARYMYKFSVPIKITNSLRVNKQKELDRGVEISRLLQTEIGERLSQNHRHFHIIKDPAYLSIKLQGEESGFEVVMRENPFYQDDRNASLIAGLCQDHAYGETSRLGSIVREIAAKEERTVEEVSVDWFERYLSISLDPLIWLYEEYGIALEAHQQNSIVKLKDGYPERFYYRDNQGYYYCESKAERLAELIPGLSQKSSTICADHVAEERLRYYFFFNHLFGLINGFGTAGLVREEKLLQILRDRLDFHYRQTGETSSLLHSLLYAPGLPCKANLLTRFHDMDELVGSLEAQSVYTMIKNPLLQKVGVARE